MLFDIILKTVAKLYIFLQTHIILTRKVHKKHHFIKKSPNFRCHTEEPTKK